ncbi:hypothetical protein D1B31_13900 [Neobacillus notoginsengisoli]|uniref:Uncharacterized protein n=1 Tax=Neobacillus notoginsengisoli TaxID=1578198 RepID=A0A417YSW6_9BACI|nr:hypothetical protein [Neobacillus notoginsengisoli]RHW39050.1 hypothetical protein D1B31_13900 [Neobacillus notoginsengisoli]
MKIEQLILKVFTHKERTIAHVEDFLTRHCIILPRKELKSKINTLLEKGLIKIHEDPSNGKINFLHSTEELEEDYWFK